MDKILAKLKAANISEADLEEIKTAFDGAVKARVDEESKTISSKADEFCKQKIDSAIKAKTAQLEDLANKYCEKKALTLAKKADRKVKEQMEKLEDAAQQYITEYFDEKFTEKYGEELQNIEESVITQFDKYLEYAITEKISPKLIERTAINETFAPIVKGIQSLFEEQYVPLNSSGKKKLKEANEHIAELENTLKEQVNANMRLTEKTEAFAKKALISEKTAGMSPSNKRKVAAFFESKSYADTKSDIEDYCEMINERAETMRRNDVSVISERTRPMHRHVISHIDDTTDDFVNEKFSKHNDDSDDSDEFLETASRFV